MREDDLRRGSDRMANNGEQRRAVPVCFESLRESKRESQEESDRYEGVSGVQE